MASSRAGRWAIMTVSVLLLSGEAPYRQPTDSSGRFTNLDGSTPQSFAAAFKWGVVDTLQRRRRRTPDRAPVARVQPRLDLLATPPRPGERARLTWLGHAGWLVQLDGVSLLVDPMLSRTLGGRRRNVPPGIPVARLPHIDAQLVTHSHYDHLDLPTLRRAGAPVVAGLGLCRMLTAEGLACTELGWWSHARVGPVTVTFVAAQHWSRRGLFDGNRTLWGGFVIDGPSARLYHAGDTAYFDGFRAIGRRFPGIDVALLPIGAYDPPWFMERMHMNPEQAVQAFVDLGARALLPMHWGTFKLADEPLDEPPVRLLAEWRRRGLAEDRRRVPAVGETVLVKVRRGRAAGARPPTAGAPRRAGTPDPGARPRDPG